MTFFRLFLCLCLMLCLLPAASFAAAYPAPYPALIEEAKEMESYETIMPVRIFNLASRFAEGPDQEIAAGIADTQLTRSPNKFVRRVGFTCIRFMGRSDFRSVDVKALIMRGLDDADNWVRYDAVWAAENVGMDSPALRARLGELMKGLDPSEYDKIPSSDAKKQLQRRAGKLFVKLSEGGAK